jgi:hypothetical protein
MSVEMPRPASDSAIQTSRIVLAIVLPSIVIAFCILAFFAAPPAAGGTSQHSRLDPMTTGSLRAASGTPAHEHEASWIASGYGVDE